MSAAQPAIPTGQQTGGTGTTTAHRIRSVLAIPAFRRLWMVSAICSMGDWLSFLALTGLVAKFTDSYLAQSFALSAVVLTQLLPGLLFAPVGGILADRFDRRKVMVVCDSLRCLFFLSIPLVGSLSDSVTGPLLWLFVANFLIGCCALLWIPAKDSAIPNLLRRRDQVETANQLSLVMTYGISVISGAGLYALITAIGPILQLESELGIAYIAVVVNGLLFLTSAILVATRIPELSLRRRVGDEASGEARETPQPASEGSDGGEAVAAKRPGALSMLRDGFRFIGTTPLIRGLVIGVIGAVAAGGAVVATAQLYSNSLSAGDTGYGLLFAAIFLGLAGGMAGAPKFAQRIPHNRLFGSAIVGAGLALFPVALAPHLWIALLVVPLVGGFAGVAFLTGLTIIGTQVDDAVRGRTVAMVQSLLRVVLVGALALVPTLLAILRPRTLSFFGAQVEVDATRPILLGAGVVAAVLGVVAYRQMDDRRSRPILADLRAVFRSRREGNGLLIAVEGDTAVDTAEQARRLTDWLTAGGNRVVLAADPALDEQRLRNVLKSVEVSGARANALVAAAVRSDVVEQVVRPALDGGAVVVMERYVDSPLAHFGAAAGLAQGELEGLGDWATGRLHADITVLLDREPRSDGGAGTEDLKHNWQVKRLLGEMAAANPDRYLVVDADGSEDEIERRVRESVGRVLRDRRFRMISDSQGYEGRTVSLPEA
nr:dTMP kinase [Actinoalloteichus caeruleus]